MRITRGSLALGDHWIIIFGNSSEQFGKKDGKGYWKSLSDYNFQKKRNWPLLNINGCFESKKEARAAVDVTFHAMKTEGVINPRDSLFKMRQAQSNVDSKSWPGRREQLLHYRMIGTLPESQNIAHAVAKQSRKRIAPTPVVGHRWLLNKCCAMRQLGCVSYC